ncbi:hypothetical protein LTS18_010879 [Coniosporium uncinatum]|uniref:Uncharacterized protein n=1 Tax=Coniosporium uncinatum TaxID=93489 RepID=A0ACC3CZ33_9PEZI|nr:hypothetical protein LTS18_010879 [Coniosporium uncinatum]
MLFFSLNYTLGHVVNTLTMVETPLKDVEIRVTAEESHAPLEKDTNQGENDKLMGAEEMVAEVKFQPVTAKIRTTIRHLHTTAGFAARWRGLRYGLLYTFLVGLISQIVMVAVPIPPIASVLAAIPLIPLHCAWTHATIAMPSKKSMYARMDRSTIRKLAVPAVMRVLMIDLSMLSIVFVAQGWRLVPSEHTHTVYGFLAGNSIFTVIFAVLVWLYVVLPTQTAFTRLEASLLSDDDETIVPFDRTLGGQLEPAVLSTQTGYQTMRAALRSFTGESRSRIAKLAVKQVLIYTVFVLLFVHVLLLELMVLPGNATKVMHDQAKAHFPN